MEIPAPKKYISNGIGKSYRSPKPCAYAGSGSEIITEKDANTIPNITGLLTFILAEFQVLQLPSHHAFSDHCDDLYHDHDLRDFHESHVMLSQIFL